MRAAVITGGEVRVEDRPEPKTSGDLVEVKVLIAPMCTEYLARRPGGPAGVLGHEAVGVVVDAAASARVARGDRVVVMPQFGCGSCELCTSGEHIHCPNQRDVLAETGSDYGTATFAQYLIKPDWLLLPVPDDISLRHAALTCCGLGPGWTAAERTRITACDTVTVTGCGPVGLGAIVNARARGALVIAIEENPYRRELARALGAVVVDPGAGPVEAQIRALTGGAGADAVVDTTGAQPLFAAATSALRRRGRAAVLAWGAELSVVDVVALGLELHGCWHWNHQRFAAGMWELVRRMRASLDRMITHHFDLDELVAAMDVQDAARCGKVFLYPHGQQAVS